MNNMGNMVKMYDETKHVVLAKIACGFRGLHLKTFVVMLFLATNDRVSKIFLGSAGDAILEVSNC